MHLSFDRGTLVWGAAPDGLPGFLWDERTSEWRAPAYRYSETLHHLRAQQIAFVDLVPGKEPRPQPFKAPQLRPYQEAALLAWEAAERRGTVVLPTGAGKTRTAIAALAGGGGRALVLAPTRVLLRQWCQRLRELSGQPVGQLGDGCRQLAPLSVATYATARLRAERLGNSFHTLVIDEAHHFSRGGSELLELFTAPLRLGLTATPPEDADALATMARLIGPVVYRCGVSELSGSYLAPLRIVTLLVELSPPERQAYQAEREPFRRAYKSWQRRHPRGSWAHFCATCQKSDHGRRALAGWRRSRSLLGLVQGKRRWLDSLLSRHCKTRCLVFAPDNQTAYEVARGFGVMPISCDIGASERRAQLEAFEQGRLRALVSARVLNEGIDVPAAQVGILLGGRQGSREYVQRVGRLLRPAEGKEALLYELLCRDTFEEYHAQRGRERLARP